MKPGWKPPVREDAELEKLNRILEWATYRASPQTRVWLEEFGDDIARKVMKDGV